MEGNIPLGWICPNLKEICQVLDNQRRPINSTDRQKRQGTIPYYGATGVIDHIDDYIFDEELLLLGEDGAPFFDKRKEVAFLIQGKSWVNNHAHVLRARKSIITNRYLYYYLNYFDYTGFVGGATRLKLTRTSLNEIPVLLPSYNEQLKIERQLDKAYDLIQKIRSRIDKIIDIRQSLLHSFLHDISSVAYPSEFLQGYLVERDERIGANWQGLRLIGVDAAKGIIDLRSSTKKGYANYKIVKYGDFVYNPMRVNIGSIAIYKGDKIALTSPDYVVFNTNEKLSSYLLLDYLKSLMGLSEISNLTQGSVRSRLYFKALVKVKIPVDHSLKAELVDGAYAVMEKIQSKLPSIEQFLNDLKNSILHKAFTGNLTSYDHQDTGEIDQLMIAIANRLDIIINKPKEISKSLITYKMGAYKSLLEALTQNGGKLTPKELWEISDYKEDIDAFYAALKREIEVNKTIVESTEKDYLLVK